MKSSEDISPSMHKWYHSFHMHFIHMGLQWGYRVEEIQDFTNQLFLDLIEKKIDPQTIRNPKAYLSIAFKRKLIDHKRKAGKKYFLDPDSLEEELFEPSLQDRLEQIQTNTWLIQEIRKAYQNLPKRCRDVIFFKFYKGLTTEEICLKTGLTKRTVYNNLFEAVKLLRAQLNSVSPELRYTSLLSLLPLMVVPFFNS